MTCTWGTRTGENGRRCTVYVGARTGQAQGDMQGVRGGHVMGTCRQLEVWDANDERDSAFKT